MKRCVRGVLLLTCVLAVAALQGGPIPKGVPGPLSGQRARAGSQISFENVTVQAGLGYAHGFIDGANTDQRHFSGGVAAGDYDGDGWVDLYVVRGTIGPGLLFRNRADGTFEEVGEEAGLDRTPSLASGPLFGDFDGDHDLDLLLLGIETARPRLFINVGGGRFEEGTENSGISVDSDTVSAAMGDYDRDGDLDLALSRWNRETPTQNVHLWRNDGGGTFTALQDSEVGLTGFDVRDYSLTPTFADMNNDGWPDLLVACDFGTSQVFLNGQDGTFQRIADDVFTDENGMGSAVADYDLDGDLDWFVSSIWDPSPQTGGWGITGNRLYRNLGDGTFEDATDEAGVREGFWGWGSCFVDFDNDRNVDLFHVNGFFPLGSGERAVGEIFADDPSRLFMSNGDGSFTEQSAERGIVDIGQGRGVSCFDYDRDGDVDIFVANNSGPPALYRNDGGNRNHFLNIRVGARGAGTSAGARVSVTAAGVTQMQEVRVGNNFVSQQPEEVHFGLGDAAVADEVRILWPDGQREIHRNVAADQFLEFGAGASGVLTLGNRIVFPHAPTGGGVAASITLMNTNFSLPLSGMVKFQDALGAPRDVTLQGLGTDSSFSFEIPAGGSLTLPADTGGPLQIGMATVVADLPIDGVFRFEFGDAHIGIPSSLPTKFATLPVFTSGDFDTGVAVSNPTGEDIFLELSLADDDGTLLETIEPPELNPLPPGGEFVRFLTELDFAEIDGRSTGTVRIGCTQGEQFAVMALVSGRGTLSSTAVTRSAAGGFDFEQLGGSYGGGAQLFVGAIPSIRGLSLTWDLSGLAAELAGSKGVNLFGFYDDSGFQGSGFSPLLGTVTLSIAPDGTFLLQATDPETPLLESLTVSGTALPEGISADYTIVLSGGSQLTGSFQVVRSG